MKVIKELFKGILFVILMALPPVLVFLWFWPIIVEWIYQIRLIGY